MNIIFLGDIVGKTGRNAVRELLLETIEEYKADFVIVNGENSAGHAGISSKIAKMLFSINVDVITLGNHTWVNSDIIKILNSDLPVIRPANYSEQAVGKGYVTLKCKGVNITVINLIGQVFLPFVYSPFHCIQNLLKDIPEGIIIVDFHAEATSEKVAMGYFLDGKVSAVIGTHTHVQTADEKILSKRTAYITDAGMCGSEISVLGIKPEIIINKFITQLPEKFEISKEIPFIQGVCIKFDNESKPISIKRIKKYLFK